MSDSTPPRPDRRPADPDQAPPDPPGQMSGPARVITVRVTSRDGILRVRLSDFDTEAVRRIRRVEGRRWNPSDTAWEIPDTPATRAHLRALFPAEDRGYVLVDSLPGPTDAGTAPDGPEEASETDLEEERGRAVGRLDRELILRGRSPRTRKLYRAHLRRFLEWLAAPPDEISGQRIRDYLVQLAEEQRVSRSYQNQAISALRSVWPWPSSCSSLG